MDISSTLRKRIAPELNHLYTVPPFHNGSGGADAGWYCREHAAHTYVVAKLLGFDADIRLGDYVIHPKDQPIILSIGVAGGHAWCRVGDMLPVDLSMTFKFYPYAPQLRMPVCKVGQNGGYTIRYTKSEETALHAPVGVAYLLEREIRTVPVHDLIDDPYVFIYDPVLEDKFSWHNVFGPDIYAAISLHCFRVATGHAKTTRNRLSPTASPQWIHETYPNARETLHHLLR